MQNKSQNKGCVCGCGCGEGGGGEREREKEKEKKTHFKLTNYFLSDYHWTTLQRQSFHHLPLPPFYTNITSHQHILSILKLYGTVKQQQSTSHH